MDSIQCYKYIKVAKSFIQGKYTKFLLKFVMRNFAIYKVFLKIALTAGFLERLLIVISR